MQLQAKSALNHAMIILAVFFIGFIMSSGVIYDICHKLSDMVQSEIKQHLEHHVLTINAVDARNYFLLPFGKYTKELLIQPLPALTILILMGNALFNILFQPVFLCQFTPQVILNVILFPFFLYAAAMNFKKVWLLLVIFIITSIRVALFDSGVEALIRHGMICELLYLLMGSAGLTGWITRN